MKENHFDNQIKFLEQYLKQIIDSEKQRNIIKNINETNKNEIQKHKNLQKREIEIFQNKNKV